MVGNAQQRMLAALIVLLSISLAPGLEARENAYQRHLTFVADTSDVRPGLFLFRMTADELAEEVFLLAPQDTRIVSTLTITAREGSYVLRLIDDESGEWVEIDKRLGVTGAGIEDLLHLAIEEEPKDREVRFIVRTSGGFDHTCEVTGGSTRGEEELIQCLVEAEVVNRLLEEIPSSLRRSAAFLASGLGTSDSPTVPHSLTPQVVLALDAQQKNGSGAAGAKHWRQVASDPIKGLVVREEPWLEFLAHFRQATTTTSRDGKLVIIEKNR